MKNKPSFFERLTGSIDANEGELEENQTLSAEYENDEFETHTVAKSNAPKQIQKSENEEGQLIIDMFQTPNEIIIQSTVAGVKPDDLDVSISQDMVTIRGRRQQTRQISRDDYFYQELYWGAFSRSIPLPQEIDTESAEATLKNGILTIKLPKLDRRRVQKIKVKSE